MGDSTEARGRFTFSYVIFQSLFQSIQTQVRLNDVLALRKEEVGGGVGWRKMHGYIICHSRKWVASFPINLGVAFPPLHIGSGVDNSPN